MGLFTECQLIMRGFCVLSCLLLTLTVAVRPNEKNIQGQNENRNGRIFFISTSIVSTTSQCYVTDTTLTACAAKRKRNLILEADDSDGLNTDYISPVAPVRREDELDSGLEDAEEGPLRDGRFLLYWATSTSTSYTSTSTLASLECTPSGFSLSLCG